VGVSDPTRESALNKYLTYISDWAMHVDADELLLTGFAVVCIIAYVANIVPLIVEMQW